MRFINLIVVKCNLEKESCIIKFFLFIVLGRSFLGLIDGRFLIVIIYIRSFCYNNLVFFLSLF